MDDESRPFLLILWHRYRVMGKARGRTSQTRRKVREHYARNAEQYERIRMEQPRGALLSARDRDLFRRLLRHLPHEGSVLEVGAGTGRFTLPALEYFETLVASDVNANMLDALRKRLAVSGHASRCEVRSEDIFELSLAERSVDAAFAVHLIPRLLTLEDQRAALSSLARLLRLKGRLLFNFRNRSSLYGMIHGGHAVPYGEMMDLLDRIGLSPVVVAGKHILARRLLNALPMWAGNVLRMADEALEDVAPNLAWDVFVVAEKR